MTKSNYLFNFLIIISMVIWGGSWVSAKILTGYLDPYSLTFLRFFVSVIFFIPIICIRKSSKKTGFKNFKFLLLGSLSMGLYFLFFFKGLERGYANIGGVFVTSLVPIYTLLITKFFMKRRFDKIDYIGVITGLLGGLIIMKFWNLNMRELFRSGNIYFLFCPLLWSLVTIFSEKASAYFSSITFSFFSHLFCTIFFMFFLNKNFIKIFSFDYVFWGNIFYLSVISSILATTLYFYSASKINSYKTSVFTFIVPASSIIFSMIFLKERIEITTFIGGLISVFAVFLVSSRKFCLPIKT